MSTPATSPADSAYAQALSKLTGLGLRMAEAITSITEAEQRTVAVAVGTMPEVGRIARSAEEATNIGLALDTANDALAQSVPRAKMLSLAFQRVARTVRQAVALERRIEQGWPLPRMLPDDRRAMLIRQAKHGVGEAIRSRTRGDDEASERLFDDLVEQLDDPDFDQLLMQSPIEDVIAHLCQRLGLAAPVPAPGAGPGLRKAATRRHEPG